MNPDLTDLQLISLGIAIAIATTFTTILILTLVYAEEIRRHLQRLGLLRGRRIPRTDFRNAPFPTHYVIPQFERRRPTICTDLASVSTMTTTCSLHRRMIMIRDTSSDEYLSSREDFPTRHDTEEPDRRHSPTPEPEDPGTSAWHIRDAQAADPWGEAMPADADSDPDYPTGTWNPGDRERALAQIEWDLPVPVLDNDDLQPKQIDASPPYFTGEALAIPRARNGLHSPAYDVRDPFAALRRNYIPFPTVRRNRIPPVPFGQWPDESDSSDSSDESDRGGQRPQGTNAAGTPLAESVPRLDHSGTTDPFNAEGPDYEWNALEQIDRDILGPEQVKAWELRRADVEARTNWQHRGTREDMEYYLATNRGAPFHFGHPTNGELMARVHANLNRELFRTHPGHRHLDLWA